MHKRTLYNISVMKVIQGISLFNILKHFHELKAALMLSSPSF